MLTTSLPSVSPQPPATKDKEKKLSTDRHFQAHFSALAATFMLAKYMMLLFGRSLSEAKGKDFDPFESKKKDTSPSK